MLLFSLNAFAATIEIQPVLEGKQYYIMKLGEAQTFTAYGFGFDKQTQQKLPDAEIKEIKWIFDERFLELQDKKDNSITLKLIKNRTSRLTVTAIIDNKSVSKTIFIVVSSH